MVNKHMIIDFEMIKIESPVVSEEDQEKYKAIWDMTKSLCSYNVGIVPSLLVPIVDHATLFLVRFNQVPTSEIVPGSNYIGKVITKTIGTKTAEDKLTEVVWELSDDQYFSKILYNEKHVNLEDITFKIDLSSTILENKTYFLRAKTKSNKNTASYHISNVLSIYTGKIETPILISYEFEEDPENYGFKRTFKMSQFNSNDKQTFSRFYLQHIDEGGMLKTVQVSQWLTEEPFNVYTFPILDKLPEVEYLTVEYRGTLYSDVRTERIPISWGSVRTPVIEFATKKMVSDNVYNIDLILEDPYNLYDSYLKDYPQFLYDIYDEYSQVVGVQIQFAQDADFENIVHEVTVSLDSYNLAYQTITEPFNYVRAFYIGEFLENSYWSVPYHISEQEESFVFKPEVIFPEKNVLLIDNNVVVTLSPFRSIPNVAQFKNLIYELSTDKEFTSIIKTETLTSPTTIHVTDLVSGQKTYLRCKHVGEAYGEDVESEWTEPFELLHAIISINRPVIISPTHKETLPCIEKDRTTLTFEIASMVSSPINSVELTEAIWEFSKQANFRNDIERRTSGYKLVITDDEFFEDDKTYWLRVKLTGKRKLDNLAVASEYSQIIQFKIDNLRKTFIYAGNFDNYKLYVAPAYHRKVLQFCSLNGTDSDAKSQDDGFYNTNQLLNSLPEQYKAAKYCKDMDAYLPSIEEVIFIAENKALLDQADSSYYLTFNNILNNNYTDGNFILLSSTEIDHTNSENLNISSDLRTVRSKTTTGIVIPVKRVHILDSDPDDPEEPGDPEDPNPDDPNDPEDPNNPNPDDPLDPNLENHILKPVEAVLPRIQECIAVIQIPSFRINKTDPPVIKGYTEIELFKNDTSIKTFIVAYGKIDEVIRDLDPGTVYTFRLRQYGYYMDNSNIKKNIVSPYSDIQTFRTASFNYPVFEKPVIREVQLASSNISDYLYTEIETANMVPNIFTITKNRWLLYRDTTLVFDVETESNLLKFTNVKLNPATYSLKLEYNVYNAKSLLSDAKFFEITPNQTTETILKPFVIKIDQNNIYLSEFIPVEDVDIDLDGTEIQFLDRDELVLSTKNIPNEDGFKFKIYQLEELEDPAIKFVRFRFQGRKTNMPELFFSPWSNTFSITNIIASINKPILSVKDEYSRHENIEITTSGLLNPFFEKTVGDTGFSTTDFYSTSEHYHKATRWQICYLNEELNLTSDPQSKVVNELGDVIFLDVKSESYRYKAVLDYTDPQKDADFIKKITRGYNDIYQNTWKVRVKYYGSDGTESEWSDTKIFKV